MGGLEISEADLQVDLDRRKPGTSRYTTARREGDEVQILSGVFEGKTTGTSIGLLIQNTDQRSGDFQYQRPFPSRSCGLHLSSKIRHAGLPWWWPLFCP